MKKVAEPFQARLREKRALFAAAGTAGGFATTVLFALYNGALGVLHSSLWHGSICAYYILLSALRGSLLAAGRRAKKKAPEEAAQYRRRVFLRTSGVMLVMNLALTVPAALMALDRRPVRMGLIPAIASAAYTTCKISSASVRFQKTGNDLLRRELSVIRLIDALVSVLVLQNTLIVAVDGGISPRMFPLAAISSAAIFLFILLLSLVWMARGAELCRN